MTVLIQTIDTPDGPFTLLIDHDGRVLSSGWTASHEEILGRLAPAHRPERIEEGEADAASAVLAYYAGDARAIDDVPVWQFGTPFQAAGWEQLRRIAPGEPLTYSEFAVALGRPTAVRAVASICARNAPALFVPCHRVLRADGGVGGFAWGPAIKRSLLSREARPLRHEERAT